MKVPTGVSSLTEKAVTAGTGGSGTCTTLSVATHELLAAPSAIAEPSLMAMIGSE